MPHFDFPPASPAEATSNLSHVFLFTEESSKTPLTKSSAESSTMAPTNVNSLEQLDFYAIDNRNAFVDDSNLAAGMPSRFDPSAPILNPDASLALNRPQSRNLAELPKGADYSKAPTTICVFCGASPGVSPGYMAAAKELAQIFHENNINLVYGGGTVGLMGEVARTLVKLSGPQSVHGIIPAPLVKYEQGPDSTAAAEHADSGSSPAKGGLPSEAIYGKTTVVEDMHTRKQMMAQAVMRGGPGSGFIALPGGYGTLEELMEVVTWNQLGIHGRGIVVLNVNGYWDGLLKWVDDSIAAGFVRENNRGIMLAEKTPKAAVEALKQYKTPEGRFKLEWGTL